MPKTLLTFAGLLTFLVHMALADEKLVIPPEFKGQFCALKFIGANGEFNTCSAFRTPKAFLTAQHCGPKPGMRVTIACPDPSEVRILNSDPFTTDSKNTITLTSSAKLPTDPDIMILKYPGAYKNLFDKKVDVKPKTKEIKVLDSYKSPLLKNRDQLECILVGFGDDGFGRSAPKVIRLKPSKWHKEQERGTVENLLLGVVQNINAWKNSGMDLPASTLQELVSFEAEQAETNRTQGGDSGGPVLCRENPPAPYFIYGVFVADGVKNPKEVTVVPAFVLGEHLNQLTDGRASMAQSPDCK